MLEVDCVVLTALDGGCGELKAPNQFDVSDCGFDALKMLEMFGLGVNWFVLVPNRFEYPALGVFGCCWVKPELLVGGCCGCDMLKIEAGCCGAACPKGLDWGT